MAFWQRKKKTPQELMVAGNFKQAIKAFQATIKEKGEDPTVMMQLANCHQKMGNEKEAKSLYIKVGSHYGDRGFFNKAVASFKKALNISPNDQGILDKLADYHGKVPKYMIDEAILKRASHAADQANAVLEEKVAEPPPMKTAAEPIEEKAEKPAAAEPAPLPESVVENDAPLDLSMADGGDFDSFTGFDELQDEINAEFAKDQIIPVENTNELIDFEEITDLNEDLADNDHEGQNKAKAAEAEIDMDATAPDTEAPPEVERPRKPARAAERVIFSSRSEEPSPTNDPPISGIFDSLDDALDTLFTDSSTAAASDQVEIDENKHWALFRTMPQEVFLDFVVALETRDFDPGQYIVRQGDAGDEMFLVADGEVDVEVDINGTPTIVATLKEGDLFGEASLLTGAPRNASVISRSFTNCLLLKRADLDELLKSHPSVMASIQSIYYTRLNENAAREQ